MSSVKEVFEEEIELIKHHLADIESSLDYIKQYGSVNLYDSDEVLKNHFKNTLDCLEVTNNNLEQITDIVRDQHEY